MCKTLKGLSDAALLRLYRAELAEARHHQEEFAELPAPQGDRALQADNDERFTLAVARCAAVRRHALQRTAPDPSAYPRPRGFGAYGSAVSDPERRPAASSSGANRRGPKGQVEGTDARYDHPFGPAAVDDLEAK